MENIERHYRELNKNIKQAVFDGTKEIMFADLSGTITTMIALAPMLFVGGYPQTVFAPLVGTLLLALIASYIISIIAVPLLSLYILAIQNPILLKVEGWFHLIIGTINKAMSALMVGIIFLSVQQYPINAQESVLSPYQEDASILNNFLNIL